ncbi:hypothetical protein [Brevibacillus sp. SYSU BS000544]|uniref:hypothetical protein n=1 Tax=Brevibacillus sp. SYSU BS000544 TaxID=3416443 RepID=UPI003CE47F8B
MRMKLFSVALVIQLTVVLSFALPVFSAQEHSNNLQLDKKAKETFEKIVQRFPIIQSVDQDIGMDQDSFHIQLHKGEKLHVADIRIERQTGRLIFLRFWELTSTENPLPRKKAKSLSKKYLTDLLGSEAKMHIIEDIAETPVIESSDHLDQVELYPMTRVTFRPTEVALNKPYQSYQLFIDPQGGLHSLEYIHFRSYQHEDRNWIDEQKEIAYRILEKHHISKKSWVEFTNVENEFLIYPPKSLANRKQAYALWKKIEDVSKHQDGDSMPVLFVHPNEPKALYVFQRNFGKGEEVLIQLWKENDDWHSTSLQSTK